MVAGAGVKSHLGGSSLENGAYVVKQRALRSLPGQHSRADPSTSLIPIICSLRDGF